MVRYRYRFLIISTLARQVYINLYVLRIATLVFIICLRVWWQVINVVYLFVS